MELAEPYITVAFQRCIEQGATHIMCHPYFLSKGKHYQEDIPNLLTEASEMYPGISFSITEPLGVHDGIIDLISQSIENELLK